MNHKHTPIVIVVCLLVLYGMFGVSYAKTKITFWHSVPLGPANDTLMAVLQEYVAMHPEIELEQVRQGSYENIAEKTLVAYAGGASPNITMFSKVGTPQFVDNGSALPLDDFIKTSKTMPRADLIEPMIQSNVFNGKIFGLPYSSSTPIMYYNRDLFAARGLGGEAPKTWQAFEQYLMRLTYDSNSDGVKDVRGLHMGAIGWYFDTWLGQNSATIMNKEETEFTFNSQPAVEAMQFLQNLFLDKRVAYTGGAPVKDFNGGKVGIVQMSTADLGINMQRAKDANMDLGVAPLTCNTQCWVSIGGANIVMMNTGTKAEQQAAWGLLEHMYSTQNLARYAIASGYMASRWSSFRSDLMQRHFQQEPRAKTTYLQLDYAQPRTGTKIPFWSEIEAAYNPAVTRVVYNEGGNVKQMLDELVAMANLKLADYMKSKQGR